VNSNADIARTGAELRGDSDTVELRSKQKTSIFRMAARLRNNQEIMSRHKQSTQVLDSPCPLTRASVKTGDRRLIQTAVR